MHWCFVLVVFVLWHCMPLTVALFEECNHRVSLNAGQKIYINSPYYPGKYPVGSSCRYTVQAPTDYQLQFKCKIDLSTLSSTTRCINEIFYFNREGSELLSGSEYFCGSGNIERKSFLNRAVISYISTPSTTPYTTMTTTATATYAKVTTQAEATQSKDEMTITVKKQTIPESDESNNKTKATTATRTPAVPPKPTPTASNTLTRKPTTALDFLFAAFTWRKNFSSSTFAATSSTLNVPLPEPRESPATSSPSPFNSTFPPHKARIIDRNSAVVGAGSFSCLVEVLEPPCDCGWSMSAKVAGSSTEAGIYEFPSMAGVMTVRDSKIFCGAAIIHHRFLLTTAHCFAARGRDSPEYIEVIVGEHDFSTVFETLLTRSYQIEAIIPHENFRSTAESVRNDIALLRTRVAIEWNRSVGPTCLPFRALNSGGSGSRKSARKPPLAGQRLDVAGWGTTSFGGPQSTRLLKTTLDVITRDACKRSVPNLEANTFCTYTPGRDACQYDSGGALYANENRLFAVGIVSYGFGCATQQPSVNTRVASYVKWIQMKTPEVQYCVK